MQSLTPIVAAVQAPVYVDLTAVFLAGLTGAVFAVKRKFALSGVLAIAVVAGLGGGLLRDIMLNTVPVALTNPRYLPTVIAAASVGFFFASLVRRWELMLDILDPIWMGLFAVIGAQMALDSGHSAWAAILTGCVTAFGGGILRDVLAGETPQLVLPKPINYFAAIVGSVLYVTLVTWLSVPTNVAEWTTIVVVFGLRMVALRFGLRTPEPVDLPRTLAKGGKAIVRGSLRHGQATGAETRGAAPAAGDGATGAGAEDGPEGNDPLHR